MKKQIVEFKVEEFGHFPIDMLRYDQCWPQSSCDVESISKANDVQVLSAKRQVLLNGVRKPTVDRWKSFGWNVMNTITWVGREMKWSFGRN